ncbi:MAG: hypothetical protein WCE62_20815 [Polyangiales bacterium]
MRTDRMKRGRIRRSSGDLDWFAEDPWAEPGSEMLDESVDDWDLDSLEATDEEDTGLGDDDEGDDPERYDDWGPIRRRGERSRESG